MIFGAHPIMFLARADPPHHATYFSPSLVSNLGYDPDVFIGSAPTFFALVHPDDQEHVADAVNWNQRGDGTYPEHNRIEAFRFWHRNGHWVWCSLETIMRLDAAGLPHELSGFWYTGDKAPDDITPEAWPELKERLGL